MKGTRSFLLGVLILGGLLIVWRCIGGFADADDAAIAVARKAPSVVNEVDGATQPSAAAIASDITGGAVVPVPMLRRLAYAQDWEGPMLPKSAAFREWTGRYLRASSIEERTGLEPEGVQIAQARRAEMRMLIERDPQRALASTVPAAVREALPAGVSDELETRVSGTGDFALMCVCSEHATVEAHSIRRFLNLGQTSYIAHDYGRRVAQLTKERASLHGIVLDGHIAVHENPLRVLERDEISRRIIEDSNPLSGESRAASRPRGADSDGSIVVEAHGKVWVLADSTALDLLEQRLVAAEAQPGPAVAPLLLTELAQSTPPVAAASNTAWTTGTKKVLVIRIDFSDAPREVLTAAIAQDGMDNIVAPFFERASYGQTRLVTTISKLYRMPKTAAAYDQPPPPGVPNVLIFDDATALAAVDHNVSDFDRVVILLPSTGSSFPAGTGSAWVGATRMWVVDPASTDDIWGVFVHELGHTFGLYHANLWQVSDGNPLSARGSSTTWGDPFDKMAGGNRDNIKKQDFNPWFKHLLGWLPESAVATVQQGGTYRVRRFDSRLAALDQTQALRIFRDGLRYYWVGYRQNFPENTSLSGGAYIIWGAGDRRDSQLLDLTTSGIDANDAALAIGATLVDSDYGLSIRPVAKGGNEPNQYLDVEVTARSPRNVVAAWGASTVTAVPAGLVNVRAVAAGERHSLALKLDGTVVAWGDNTYGQATVPSGLNDVMSIAAGGNVSGAVRKDGTIVLWGDNSAGQTTVPTDLPPIAKLAIGYDHVVALTLRNNGTVLAWGNNSAGQASVPPGLAFITTVAAGYRSSFAINGNTSGGQLRSWGASYGPALPNVTDIDTIVAGSYHGLRLRNDGTVQGWGDNSRGQISVPAGLSDVVTIAAGAYHSLAVKRNGTIVGWGDNGSGQAAVPAGLPQGMLVAAGGAQSLAVVGGTVFLTTQPQSQDFVAGRNVTFTATAAGQGPFTYQWRKNGTNIPEATNATLTLTEVSTTAIGSFDLVVTGPSGSITSAPAVLATPITIKTQPRNQFAVIRQSMTFTVEAEGTELSYQWRKNRVPIPGATQPTLTLPNLAYADAVGGGGYDVLITNLRGIAVSRGVNLTVFEIFSNPSTTEVGGVVRFVISSSGVGPLSWQWRKNGVNIAGATAATYMISSAQAADTGVYTLIATNADGSFTSNPATLSVGPTPLAIVVQPQGQTVALGASTTLGVVAMGNPAPRYQWRKDGVAIPGATTSTYPVPSVAYGDVAGYSVVVSNAQGSVTSEVAKLTVPGAFSRFINLSVRSNAGSGAETLIVGFVVSGTLQKQLLIRGVGPTLATFGVANTLADPSLRLLAGDGRVLNQNDDWGGTPALVGASAQVGAFALPPNSKDAALLAALQPGAYSVQVAAAAGAGVALVEAYDADADAPPPARLVNLSVRSIAGSDGNVLIAGFVVSGNISKTLLIRGVGPTLAAFGVGGVLADPQLALFDSNGVRMNQNDNWSGDSALGEAFTSVGAFALPANSRDAALLVTLRPGAYSAQVSGVGGTSGVALVEIYEMP